jgi:hypothetical protein
MTTPLTIRKAETLDQHITRLIESARSAIGADGRGTAAAKINRNDIVCQVTVKVSNGDDYVLFYRNGKRTSRSRLHSELGVPTSV